VSAASAPVELKERIEALYALPPESLGDEVHGLFQRLLRALEEGAVRAAEPGREGWTVNGWVKKGILLGFRLGKIVATPEAGPLRFFDKDTLLPRKLTLADGVRVVPGGTAVRSGAYLARGVVVMPPAYVNVGAWVGEGTMIDSHALVGSCAQVGRRVHLSAGAMLGGVLEPVGALPVIVEDEVLVGGNCGVYEGAIVGRRAVLGSGVILTGSVTVYDVPRQATYRRTATQPLRIPEGAVVVPGSRGLAGAFAEKNGLSLYTPVIVKYRDEKTDGATALEEALR
jgi:2,3,4,5-tetrahydropyridine-2-carboxylate N-succinyltransferase